MPRPKTIRLRHDSDIYQQFADQTGMKRHDAKKLLYSILYGGAKNGKYKIIWEEIYGSEAQTLQPEQREVQA